MRSATARDRMVARVQETHAKYPQFIDLPESPTGDLSAKLKSPDGNGYIAALYEICERGEVVGRFQDMVMGASVDDDDDI